LSEASENICLVFSPKYDKPFKVPKLNKAPSEPIKEGRGIRIFENSRIGDFCVVVCYDVEEDKIFRRIREKYRRGKCFTLFVVSCTTDIEAYRGKCDILALSRRESRKRYNSELGLTAHVILADSFHGLSYYTAPVKGNKKRKNEVCAPVIKNKYFYIYKILVEEMSKARGGEKSNIFYAIHPHH